MVYVDTSVLVAYYCPEKISDQVEKILVESGAPAISRLTEVELASAVSRKVRENTLSLQDGTDILSMFHTHLNEESYVFLPIQPKHFSTAINWIEKFDTPLRTLDALHLAIAALHKVPLLTADITFAESAKNLGIAVKVISPIDH